MLRTGSASVNQRLMSPYFGDLAEWLCKSVGSASRMLGKRRFNPLVVSVSRSHPSIHRATHGTRGEREIYRTTVLDLICVSLVAPSVACRGEYLVLNCNAVHDGLNQRLLLYPQSRYNFGCSTILASFRTISHALPPLTPSRSCYAEPDFHPCHFTRRGSFIDLSVPAFP